MGQHDLKQLNVIRSVNLVIVILFSGKFQHYDLGTIKKNIEKYGQPKPPEYDLKKVTSPVVLYYSKNDRIVDSGVSQFY